MKIIKKCLICNRKLFIKLNNDRTYSGGHYFGKNDIPNLKNWKIRIVGKIKLGNKKIDVVNNPPVKSRIEYWECNKCYK